MSLTAEETRELQAAWHDPRRRFGEYVVLRELGRGGMGVVLKAYDPRTERLVAIKQLLQHRNERQLKRFEREARLTSQLQHPSIPRTFQVVASGPNAPYLVMEFVRGAPLDQVWGGHGHDGRRVAQLVLALAEAVACAHERGILHRDLKPQNVVVSEEGRPMVLDFGLAKELQSDAEGLTKTGSMLGSPSYMAPEMVSNAKNAGPACDVYGLGAILYQGLTGGPPFPGDDLHEILGAVLGGSPTPPRELAADIDPALEAICMVCLAKDPAARYASASELADELQGYLSGEPREEAFPLGLAVGVGALLLAGIGALVFGVLSATAETPETAAQPPRPRKSAPVAEPAPAPVETSDPPPLKTPAQPTPQRGDGDAAKDWARRGKQRLDRGDCKAAIELLSHAARLDRSNVDVFAWRGFAYFKLGRYREAADDYSQAIRLRPRTSLFWANRATNRMRLGKYREALSDARQAIKLGTQESGVYLNAGECCFELGDLRGAERLFSGAIRLRPARLLFYERRAAVRKRLKDYRGAIRDYDRYLSRKPRADFYASRAWCYFKVGRHGRAARDYGMAIRLRPDHGPHYRNRAANLRRIGQYAQAVRDLDQAVRLEPGRLETYMFRAKACFDAKQYRKALQDVDRVLARFPEEQQALELRAKLLKRLEKTGG